MVLGPATPVPRVLVDAAPYRPVTVTPRADGVRASGTAILQASRQHLRPLSDDDLFAERIYTRRDSDPATLVDADSTPDDDLFADSTAETTSNTAGALRRRRRHVVLDLLDGPRSRFFAGCSVSGRAQVARAGRRTLPRFSRASSDREAVSLGVGDGRRRGRGAARGRAGAAADALQPRLRWLGSTSRAAASATRALPRSLQSCRNSHDSPSCSRQTRARRKLGARARGFAARRRARRPAVARPEREQPRRRGPRGARRRGGARGALAQLSKLYVDKNRITDAGVAAFAAASGGALPRLYELWLSNNELTSAGAAALFGALGGGALSNLGDLRLQYNRLDDGALAALQAAAPAAARSPTCGTWASPRTPLPTTASGRSRRRFAPVRCPSSIL